MATRSAPPTASLFVPCAQGVEALLADELAAIVGRAAEAGRGGAWIDGTLEDAMRVNLWCRLGQRVLWPLAQAPYADEHAIYALARRVAWAEWISPDETLRVDVSAHRSPLKSLNFAALRVKDAVCDALREATGARPSVDTHAPTLPIALYLGPEHAALYVDTSGEALFKRGWRDARGGREAVKGEAPLKETLAAAMLAAAGWRGRAEDGPLLDPFCGAGTIAIEAAQLACGIAPGARRRFAFEQQRPFRALTAQWAALQQAARRAEHAPAVAVFAGDVSFRMTDFATRNAERAGVAHAIAFKTADALQRPPPADAGTLMMNPPYGERIEPKGMKGMKGRAELAEGRGERDAWDGARERVDAPPAEPPRARAGRESFDGEPDDAAFYAALAAQWKRHYGGWTAWCLSPDARLPSKLRLKESRRVPLWNGAIECRLFRFDLVTGRHRRADGDDHGAGAGAGAGAGVIRNPDEPPPR